MQGPALAGLRIANLTGAASLNVLKAGDTMTGALQLPAGTTAAPSLVFTGSTTAGLSANSGNLSFLIILILSVYSIAKHYWGRYIGLLSALITSIMPVLLSQSPVIQAYLSKL